MSGINRTSRTPPKKPVKPQKRRKALEHMKEPSVTRQSKPVNAKNMLLFEKFAAQYLVTHNASTAALACGYAESCASRNGYELIHHPVVQEIIRRLQAEMMVDLGADFRRVTKETARIAFFDPRRVFDELGLLIPVHKLDEDTAACIKSVKVTETYDWEEAENGKRRRRVNTGRVTELRFWDKNAALDRLTRVLGHDREGDRLQRPLVVFNFNMPRAQTKTIEGETIDQVQQPTTTITAAIPRPPSP